MFYSAASLRSVFACDTNNNHKVEIEDFITCIGYGVASCHYVTQTHFIVQVEVPEIFAKCNDAIFIKALS